MNKNRKAAAAIMITAFLLPWLIMIGIVIYFKSNKPTLVSTTNYRYIDLPEEIPVGSTGDILVIEKNDHDTLRIGYFRTVD